MQRLREVGLNGDAIFHIFLASSTVSINIRAAAGFTNHLDWMVKNQSDFHALLRIANLPLTSKRIRDWSAYPAVLEHIRHGITRYFAMAIFIVNHSLVVASHAYEIVTPRLTRATELLPDGSWAAGHHFCAHTEESLRTRAAGPNNQYRDGNAKLHQAMQIAQARLQNVFKPPAPVKVNYQVQVITKNHPLNVRRRPSTQNSAIIGSLPIGSVHSIVQESTGTGAVLWGQLPADHEQCPNGWISLDHTRRAIAVNPGIPSPPVVPAGSFRVQVGALRTANCAEIVIRQLESEGYNRVRDSICIVSGNGFYRVRVGRLQTRCYAESLETLLSGQGFKTWVVQE
jgi:cell division septation protein DedD